jgi:xylulokinase
MEYGDASGTALLNVRTRVWDHELLACIDPDLAGKMPPVGSSRIPIGHLRPELAARWWLPDGVVISAGGGDNMMGAIGTANVGDGCVTASLGTSGTLYACSPQPVVDPQGEIAGFCDSTDAWLPLLCTMNVTVATEAVRALFGWSHPVFEAAVASAPVGSDGLLFLPYLQGERTPNLPGASGVLHGMTVRNMQPSHLARAAVEGVTLGLAYGLERLRALGIATTAIRLTGGGSKSAAWRQVCADVFNCPVVTLAEAEGAALGAAIQALASVQTEKTVNDWARALVKINEAERTEPRADAARAYAAIRERHAALTRGLAAQHFL